MACSGLIRVRRCTGMVVVGACVAGVLLDRVLVMMILILPGPLAPGTKNAPGLCGPRGVVVAGGSAANRHRDPVPIKKLAAAHDG